MKNFFFKIALTQAIRFIGKPTRMLHLVAQFLHRLYTVDRKYISVSEFRTQLCTMARLVTSYAQGHYRAISLKTLLTIMAAFIYFLNPLDLVPDAIFGVGLADDLAVLTWVFRAAHQEIDKFLQWEKTEISIIRL